MKVVITAGPTREAIDPVRYISNHSSGKMGYAVAQAARDSGAEVTLISGPVALDEPTGVTVIQVESAEQMLEAVLSQTMDVFVGVAAVSDYRPAQALPQKHKKSDSSWSIELIKNPDVLATVSALKNRPFCVGFAAETENHREHALAKMQRKNLDLIALNDVSASDIGFDHTYNALQIFWPEGEKSLPRQPKTELAQALWCEILERFSV